VPFLYAEAPQCPGCPDFDFTASEVACSCRAGVHQHTFWTPAETRVIRPAAPCWFHELALEGWGRTLAEAALKSPRNITSGLLSHSGTRPFKNNDLALAFFWFFLNSVDKSFFAFTNNDLRAWFGAGIEVFRWGSGS
jgi:hypothetical protein